MRVGAVSMMRARRRIDDARWCGVDDALGVVVHRSSRSCKLDDATAPRQPSSNRA